MRDFHSHSNYSDGTVLWSMVQAAEEAGLDGVGIADHCLLPESDTLRDARAALGHTLDETYERRRRGIRVVRQEASIEVYDAVEMDYVAHQEDRIAAFLDEADFDYVIGSVHAVDDRRIQYPPNFADDTDGELDAVVDEYFEQLLAMIESGLFDIVAHPDLVERNPSLRGRASTEHYEQVADALEHARALPELNAGRALREDGSLHPTTEFFAVLREHDVTFTIGTDSHHPDEYAPRMEFLTSVLEDHEVTAASPPSL